MKNIYTTLLTIVLSTFVLQGQLQLGADITGTGELWGDAVETSSDGSRVAILGDLEAETAIVRVYEWQNNAWTQLGTSFLADAENLIIDIALSGDGSTLAIGFEKPGGADPDSGYIKVFDWSGGVWGQVGENIKNGEDNYFGYELSLSSDGNRLASSIEDGARADFVVYEFANNAWTQLGSNVRVEFMGGPTIGDTDVAISDDGQRLAISLTSGAASNYRLGVYEWSNNSWTQLGADINLDGDFVNRSSAEIKLSANGNRMAAGFRASGADDSERGWAIIYQYDNTDWTVLGDTIKGKADGDNLGNSISISDDGDVVAVGADQLESTTQVERGYVQVFRIQNTTWTQVGTDIVANEDGDEMGSAIALSGDAQRLVAAAPYAGMDDNGIVRVYDFSTLTSINEGFAKTVSSTVFPNPARGIVSVVLQSESSSNISIGILNALGQVVMRPYIGTIRADQTLQVPFDTGTLTPGMYTYRVSFDDGSRLVGKFLKID